MMKQSGAIDKDNSDPGPGAPVPSKISFRDNDNHVSPLGSGSILASAPGTAANKRADLRRLFVKSLSWASSLTSSPEGNDNDDSPKGNQSHNRTIARTPPSPPPPQRRRSMTSSSWRKQRSHLNPSSTSEDPEHSLLRRWSEGSRDTCATEDEEEVARMMPRMKLEQSDCSAKEGKMNESFHSFVSSSKKKKELVVTFDEDSPKTLDSNKITSSAKVANAQANKRADLRRLFVKSVSWASSLTSSSEGNEGSPKGKQSHTRTIARNPPPPPPPRRSTSSSRRKQRSSLMNPSSFSEDPTPTHRVRRSSEGSCDTYAIEDKKEHVCRMSGMKMEAEEGKMNESFHSSVSSPPPEEKKSHDLVVTFDDESPMTLDSNKITSSAKVANAQANKRADLRRLFFKSASWASSLTSSSEGNEDKPKGNKSSSMAASRNKSSYIQRSVKVSQFEETPKPRILAAPQDCDKHGRCKLHPQYKLYEKKFLGIGGYEFIRNCPICTSSSPDHPELRRRNYIPNSANIRAESMEQQHRSDSRQRLRRSRTHSPDISPGFNTRFSRGSFASALKSIHQKLPTHKSSRRQHQSHRHGRDYRRLSSSDRQHSMDEAMGFEKDVSVLEKGQRGRDIDKPLNVATFEKSKEPPYHMNKKNPGSNQFVHESSKVNFDKKTGRCKKHPSIVLANKSTFRPNSWEIIKKSGCPLCSEAQDESNLDEAGQHLVEGTMKERGLSLKGGLDSGGAITRMSKKNTKAMQSNHYKRASSSAPSEGSQVEKVFRLPYTTPLRESGWYTGEVDSEGRPHGYGRMRFKTGYTFEGKWSHGYAYGEGQREKSSRMKSGFGSNKAAWRQSDMAPSAQNVPASSLADTPAAASARHGVMHQSQQLPQPRRGYFPAQMQQAHLQQQQQQAQQQQAWIDMTPQERQRSMTEWYAIWLSDTGNRPT